MASLQGLDMSDAEGLREGFTAVPPGEYQIYLDTSDRVSTSTAPNEMLKCTFVIAAGEYQNRKLFCNFNLWNSNQDAVRIAKSQWAAICFAALGQPPETVRDSSQLNSRIFFAEVANVSGQSKNSANKWVDDPEKPRRNEIVFNKDSIKSLNGYTPTSPTAAKPVVSATSGGPVATETTSKPAASTPPWKR